MTKINSTLSGSCASRLHAFTSKIMKTKRRAAHLPQPSGTQSPILLRSCLLGSFTGKQQMKIQLLNVYDAMKDSQGLSEDQTALVLEMCVVAMNVLERKGQEEQKNHSSTNRSFSSRLYAITSRILKPKHHATPSSPEDLTLSFLKRYFEAVPDTRDRLLDAFTWETQLKIQILDIYDALKESRGLSEEQMEVVQKMCLIAMDSLDREVN